jgi:hypothetical protein
MLPVHAEVDPAFGALLTERLRAVKLRTGKLRGPKAA